MNKKQMEFFIKNINYQDIYEVIIFACYYKNSLTNDDKEKIVKRFSTVSNEYIIENILNNIEWLTKKHIDFIINSILKYPNGKFYSYIINECSKLTKENIDSLVKEIADNQSPSSIYLFLCNTQKLSEQNINILLNALVNFSATKYIVDIADRYKNLSPRNLDLLVEGIIKGEDPCYICSFLESLDLSLENTDKLINKLVSLKSGEYIYETAKNCKNLSPKNIESLVNGIIDSNDSFYIYKFLTGVENLNTNYYKALTDKLFELKDFDVIKMMIDDYLNGSYHKKIGVDFEKRILNTKDLLIITYYLIKTNNKNLIKLFFETTEKFLVFVLINKELLDKDETLICKLTENISFKDADFNMKEYVKSKN